MKRLRLVTNIDADGKATRGWFRVKSSHRTARAARRRAIQYRKDGWLARVVDGGDRWLVAVRRPRIKAPALWMLDPNI